jgi:hypothetical protein
MRAPKAAHIPPPEVVDVDEYDIRRRVTSGTGETGCREKKGDRGTKQTRMEGSHDAIRITARYAPAMLVLARSPRDRARAEGVVRSALHGSLF